MKKVTVLVVSAFLSVSLTGCSQPPVSQDSSQPPDSQDSSQESSDSAETSTGWNCKSEEDGLGEKYGCQTGSRDNYGQLWVLTVLCTSDQRALHAITGWDDLNPIKFSTSGWQSANVRIDSSEIEEWDFFATISGEAFKFAISDGDRMDEASSTWELFRKISSAKTLGFQAFDARGSSQSALFNVEDSAPIAAVFADRGC